MRKRTDANHKSLMQELKSIGASVHDTSMVGGGFPDCVVGFRGNNYIAEFKVEKGKLRPSQVQFQKEWRGHKPFVMRKLEDFLENIT